MGNSLGGLSAKQQENLRKFDDLIEKFNTEELDFTAKLFDFPIAKLRTFINNDQIRKNAKEYALFRAASAGDVEVVKLLVSEWRVNVNAIPINITPLAVAAKNGNLPLINFLIDNGAVVDASIPSDFTPFYYAAISGQVEAMECLHAHGAALNIQFEDGATPLLGAIWTGKVEAVEYLLQHGANLDVVKQGFTPVAFAQRAVARNKESGKQILQLIEAEPTRRASASLASKESKNTKPPKGKKHKARESNIQKIQVASAPAAEEKSEQVKIKINPEVLAFLNDRERAKAYFNSENPEQVRKAWQKTVAAKTDDLPSKAQSTSFVSRCCCRKVKGI